MQEWRFRALRQDDLPEVLQIERASFPAPWRRRCFVDQMRALNVRCYVALEHARVVGHAVLVFDGDGAALLNFAIHPGFRRRGGGRSFMAFLLDVCRLRELARMRVEVRESNLPGQLFLRGMGFRATHVLRKHFADTAEDAYVMDHPIVTPAAGSLPQA
jgi:ribosomal-protein-alanine N-acetyltransferase